MKKGKRHIICTWILLVCFAAGQWAVYAHQHKTFAGLVKTSESRTVVTEKCQLCDAMHSSSMGISVQQHFTPLVVTDFIYTQGKYDFVSIALILSPGRAPPLS